MLWKLNVNKNFNAVYIIFVYTYVYVWYKNVSFYKKNYSKTL